MMSILHTFLSSQRKLEESRQTAGSRLVGYVISADYDTFTISTCTAIFAFKSGSTSSSSAIISVSAMIRFLLLL